MSLAEDLLVSVEEIHRATSLVAKRVEAGPRFFGIAAGSPAEDQLTTAGVAFLGARQRESEDAGALRAAECRGQTLGSVAHWLRVGDSRERTALGAAALNSLLTLQLRRDGTALGEENGLELLAKESEGKRLAVVGRFPHLDEMRAQTARSWVLELEPEEGESSPPDAPAILAEADVIGITGSTLANGTLEGLLKHCRRDAFVVLIGPTTPLSPVLFDYGVNALCGVLAEDPDQVLDSIVNDGSTRRIPGTRAVSLRRPG